MTDDTPATGAERSQTHLSIQFHLDDVAGDGMRFHLRADDEELGSLTKRLGVVEVESVEAWLDVARTGEPREIMLQGRVCARLVQSCVVTLEPVVETIDAPLVLKLTDHEQDDEIELELGEDADDPPEEVEGGIVDLGDIVAQQVALEMEPFPRAPEAAFKDAASESDDPEPTTPNPFEALAALRDKLGK